MQKNQKTKMNEFYECIKPIKRHNIIFMTGERIVIIKENDNSYMLSDENYLKGFTLNKEEFNSFFKRCPTT